MEEQPAYRIDSVSQTALEWMGVKDVDELLALPAKELVRRLSVAPFPPSEKFLGIVLLMAVERLRDATEDLAVSSEAMETKASIQVKVAWLTLAVAAVSLVVTIVAVLAAQ
ncbi:MAG: hypothetical protein ACRDPA_27510 [Solirubrobacteraceae bacterium]